MTADTEPEESSQYWVAQDDGFDSGRLKAGPYESFTAAVKIKNAYERNEQFEYRVLDETEVGDNPKSFVPKHDPR